MKLRPILTIMNKCRVVPSSVGGIRKAWLQPHSKQLELESAAFTIVERPETTSSSVYPKIALRFNAFRQDPINRIRILGSVSYATHSSALTVRNLLRSACFLLERRPLSHEVVGLLMVPLSLDCLDFIHWINY
jgi:hypothetical protein